MLGWREGEACRTTSEVWWIFIPCNPHPGNIATQAKLFREMHVNLEDIKRSALLQIGKSDVAPLHMKRQALRIAITEDEINKLKDDNAELNLTITKLRLWHEMKLMNLVSMYEKKLAQAEQEKQQSSSQYWGNQKAIEEKDELMKQQLAHTQNMLSQSEMEVEQLRKDLQLQLKNKKDLVSWKVWLPREICA